MSCGEPNYGIIAQTVGTVLPGAILTAGSTGASWGSYIHRTGLSDTA